MATKPEKIKEMHWGMIILWSLLSLGIYYGYWFYSRLDGFNALADKNAKLLSRPMANFLLAISVLSIVIGLPAAIILEPAPGADPSVLGTLLDAFFRFGTLIPALYLSFAAKDIMAKRYPKLRFSSLMTFFFTSLYLQYKVNEASKGGK